jgi:hypothetical protein
MTHTRTFWAPMALAASLMAAPAFAQGEPQQPTPQPPTQTVPNPSSGTPDSSAGPVRPGGNAGNTGSRPESQRGRSASPSDTTTEGPSLEQREVTPDQRPDQPRR